ncbi:TerD family protein [Kitasatospora sp. NPDC006697]|uniref:TerD family protein n=1 Tax=Kitasatospora sp. NPDC006697 TaxID=3364020 RepID=UPI003686337E
MGEALTKGGNVSLGRQAPGVGTVLVGMGWTADPAYDLDASALLCDGDGRVVSDEHFVFFNNLRSPDGSVRHHGSTVDGSAGPGDRQQIEVELASVPAVVQKIVFAVAIYDAAQRRQSFGSVRQAFVRLADPGSGTEIARYQLADEPRTETAMVFGELYRHNADWKFRAIGQGYASGLAGIATDYGVALLQAPAPASPPPPPSVAVPAPAPTSAPAPAPVPVYQSAAAAAAQPVPVTPRSTPVTCFFDPSHGVGGTAVVWSPQWGVPRQVQACAVCAQRVQTTAPPFYTPPQPVQHGYPQPVQQGYPQQAGYPQQQGQQPPDQQRRYGTGALIGAGVAGVLGGVLLDEAFSDDRPDVVVNNYYEDDDGFF